MSQSFPRNWVMLAKFKTLFVTSIHPNAHPVRLADSRAYGKKRVRDSADSDRVVFEVTA